MERYIGAKLLDLGLLGTDTEVFLHMRAFMEGLDLEDPKAVKFMEAFDLVYKTYVEVVKEAYGD